MPKTFCFLVFFQSFFGNRLLGLMKGPCFFSLATPPPTTTTPPTYPPPHPTPLCPLDVPNLGFQDVRLGRKRVSWATVLGEIIPPPSTIRGFQCTALFYCVPIRTIPRAAAFNRRCRHPFSSVPPLMPPSIFIGAAACRHWCRPRAGSFPFPREKGSEKGSQKVWEGCAEKNRLPPEVWLEVCLSGLQQI